MAAAWGPDQRASGPVLFAGFGRRLVATIIDWAIFAIVSTVALTVLLFVPIRNFFIVVDPLVFAGGFAWLWTRARTPGMAAVGYRLVDAATGGAPRLRRLVPRAVAALILYGEVAAVAFAPWLLADEDTSAAWVPVVLVGVPALAILAIVAYLWTLWDPRRQTLVDKLCGVVALRDSWPSGPILPPGAGTTSDPGPVRT